MTGVQTCALPISGRIVTVGGIELEELVDDTPIYRLGWLITQQVSFHSVVFESCSADPAAARGLAAVPAQEHLGAALIPRVD